LFAIEHEVAGVLGGFVEGGALVVRLLVVGAAGDLVVLDAEMASNACLVQVRLQVFVIKIEAGIAVKLAGVVGAGLAFDGAPNQLARFGVAAEGGDAAAGANDRSVNTEFRPRLGEENAVRVGKEVAET